MPFADDIPEEVRSFSNDYVSESDDAPRRTAAVALLVDHRQVPGN
ncbi:hypothetical protein [Arthrobacter polaris]|nr:hypothetical protein [Arthrobacter polaris]